MAGERTKRKRWLSGVVEAKDLIYQLLASSRFRRLSDNCHYELAGLPASSEIPG